MLKKPNRDYLRIFLTVAGCILFYFLLNNLSHIVGLIGKFAKVCNPILYGFVIAYLLNPLMTFFVSAFTKVRKKEKPTRGIRIVALVFTYLVALLAVSAIALIIVPQAINSVTELVKNINGYTESFSAWFGKLVAGLEEMTGNGAAQKALENAAPKLLNALSGMAEDLVPRLQDVVSFVKSFTTVIGALLFGLFLSVYMLFDKDNLIARVKKTIYTLFKKSTANRVILFGRETNETVGNFINGKILDSFIIGVLSYVIFLIFNIPYAGLFAVIIGITNLIPIVGPIIGGVINGLLLLFVEPGKLITFLIIVIIIQQLDGNVLGPRILGKATGLSGFWVMVALTLGGGLFGLWGMLLAVPVFTVLYRAFGRLVNNSLKNGGLPADTGYYVDYPPHEEISDQAAVHRSFSLKALFVKVKHKLKKGEEEDLDENALPPGEGEENKESPASTEDPASGQESEEKKGDAGDAAL